MEIRSYGKSELAMLYFPDSELRVATNHLTQWIRNCPELKDALRKCHQSRFAKFYSAEAVRQIVYFLGEP